MSYKTILAYLPDKDRVDDLMGAVIPMAETHEAHITGLHILVDSPDYGFVEVPGYMDLLDQQRAARKSEAGAVKAAFEDACGATAVPTEWRCEDIYYANAGNALVRQARLADIVVISQKDNTPRDPWADPSTQIIMHAGRPVLIIPEHGVENGIGRNVIVAWDGSREAARAAFDALPVLKRADSVRVMVVNPDEESRETALSAGDDLALTLSRHGVNAEASTVYAPDISVPNELLSRASDDGSDLLVMGCYSHSRLRELILGGATREIMKDMTIPVLMSH